MLKVFTAFGVKVSVLVHATAWAGEASSPAAPPAGSTSSNIWDGVYSNAQAKRGDTLYAQHCAMCHMIDMGGKEPAPELAGDNFLSKWLGRSVGDLYSQVASTMPAGNPAILTPAQYADVIAVLLQANNFKAGKSDLSSDTAKLNKITIKKKGG